MATKQDKLGESRINRAPSRDKLLGGGKHNKASVIEQIPMGGYIKSIFAQILGSLR